MKNVFNPQHALFSKLIRLGFVINIISISILAFLPGNDVPTISAWDKANHFIAFLVLGGLLSLSYKAPLQNISKRVLLPLIAYGLLIEVIQSVLPSRYFSLLDVFADTIGIMLGILCAYLYLKLFKTK